jgi:hypothetical protein
MAQLGSLSFSWNTGLAVTTANGHHDVLHAGLGWFRITVQSHASSAG